MAEDGGFNDEDGLYYLEGGDVVVCYPTADTALSTQAGRDHKHPDAYTNMDTKQAFNSICDGIRDAMLHSVNRDYWLTRVDVYKGLLWIWGLETYTHRTYNAGLFLLLLTQCRDAFSGNMWSRYESYRKPLNNFSLSKRLHSALDAAEYSRPSPDTIRRIKEELHIVDLNSGRQMFSERQKLDQAMRECIEEGGNLKDLFMQHYPKPREPMQPLDGLSTSSGRAYTPTIPPQSEVVVASTKDTVAKAHPTPGKDFPEPDGALKTDKPSLQTTAPGQTQALHQELAKQDKYRNPRVEHDCFRGRRPHRKGQEPYQGVENLWSNLGLQPTPQATACERLVDLLKANKLTPRDIDGAMFRSMPIAQVKMLARNFNFLSAHVSGALYDDKYRNNRDDLHSMRNKLKPGDILICPITESLMDEDLSIDDPEVSHDLHGSTIRKQRPCIVMQVSPETLRIELRPCTSFQGNLPPKNRKEDFVRLVHVGDAATQGKSVDDNGHQLIRYDGPNQSPVRSYVCLGESYWTGINHTPCSSNDCLTVEGFQALGDLIGFSEDHPFVKRGRHHRAERAKRP